MASLVKRPSDSLKRSESLAGQALYFVTRETRWTCNPLEQVRNTRRRIKEETAKTNKKQ